MSFEMLQVDANGIARATVDDRPQERSREPARPINARSRNGEEGETAPICTALVIDEKPKLERRVEIVARVELLDRDDVRDARWSAGQRIDDHMVDAHSRLEAEV